MSKEKTTFIVTTFKKIEKDERFGGYDLGSNRSVGIFETFEEAEKVVVNNVGDICETIYDYALIQEIGFGLYPALISQELYKVKDITQKGEDGIDYYNPGLTYEKIVFPPKFQQYSITIG